MHLDDYDLRFLVYRRRGLPIKLFVSELHDQGFSCEDTVEVISRVFGVPRSAARLFVQSHPAWRPEDHGKDHDEAIRFTF